VGPRAGLVAVVRRKIPINFLAGIEPRSSKPPSSAEVRNAWSYNSNRHWSLSESSGCWWRKQLKIWREATNRIF
jgi:hypothetical protein